MNSFCWLNTNSPRTLKVFLFLTFNINISNLSNTKHISLITFSSLLENLLQNSHSDSLFTEINNRSMDMIAHTIIKPIVGFLAFDSLASKEVTTWSIVSQNFEGNVRDSSFSRVGTRTHSD